MLEVKHTPHKPQLNIIRGQGEVREQRRKDRGWANQITSPDQPPKIGFSTLQNPYSSSLELPSVRVAYQVVGGIQRAPNHKKGKYGRRKVKENKSSGGKRRQLVQTEEGETKCRMLSSNIQEGVLHQCQKHPLHTNRI